MSWWMWIVVAVALFVLWIMSIFTGSMEGIVYVMMLGVLSVGVWVGWLIFT